MTEATNAVFGCALCSTNRKVQICADCTKRFEAAIQMERLKELSDDWRQWLRLVFTHLSADDISAMSDVEFRRVVCEEADRNGELARKEIPNKNATLPPSDIHRLETR